MTRTLVFLLASSFAVREATAAQQQGTITGRITDEAGAPLAGANVVVDGTNLGTRSDRAGGYRVTAVPAGSE
jgi:TonB-dependent starch-binding outer membrane protein SusC